MNKNILLYIIGSLLLLTACTTTQPANVVSVQGTANIKVQPDQAIFYINIQTLKDTAEEAQDENTQISEDVIRALEDAGIKKEDIETQNYNVYKREDWTENGVKFKGYQADHGIKVKVHDIERVGRYIDLAVKAGATQITSVNFELSEDKQKETFNKALAQAGGEAKQKAETLAQSVGGRLGKIVRISESNSNYYPIPIYKDMMVAESGRAADVPIQPQTLEVTATVTVDYEIK
ncbi:MAG: SIMPL domain-containing protein [Nanoarchaeota archaeon]|nr:SIMPL domain-containing protein [Nanoarchaeota archaeon]